MSNSQGRSTLSARISVPVAMFVSAVVVALIGLAPLRFDGVHDWRVVVPCLVLISLGALQAATATRTLRARRSASLTVTPLGFRIGEGDLIMRDVVEVVRYDSDLTFKGVRIELTDGRLVRIPVHLHLPSTLLRVFAEHRYPVAR